MNAGFIICEFNPLHFGHRLIINEAKKHGAVVCIMSGNFVQRGDLAIVDKWTRTKMALAEGADLVLELPISFAMSGAESFSMGAVHIANSLGLGGKLFFGSESGNTAQLSKVSDILLSEEFSEKLAHNLNTSKDTFAVSRKKTIDEILGKEYGDIISQPNNILGIEYIKALKKLNSSIEPSTISRIGAGHDLVANLGELCSASEIRQRIQSGKKVSSLMPKKSYEILMGEISAGNAPSDITLIERAILSKLRSMKKVDFAALPDISEGIEMRLFNESREAKSFDDLCQRIKTKRYTMARIRRLVLSAYIGISNNLPSLPPYIRILGLNKNGEEILSSSKSSLPFISTGASFNNLTGDAKALFDTEVLADDLYALSLPTPNPCSMDFTKGIIKIK